MAMNPYESGKEDASGSKTRANRWLIWSGIASLALAATCLLLTVVGMVLAFRSIATSTTTTPSPSDLAQGISVASLPSIAVVPFGILGIVLLIAGVVFRNPVDRDDARR